MLARKIFPTLSIVSFVVSIMAICFSLSKGRTDGGEYIAQFLIFFIGIAFGLYFYFHQKRFERCTMYLEKALENCQLAWEYLEDLISSVKASDSFVEMCDYLSKTQNCSWEIFFDKTKQPRFSIDNAFDLAEVALGKKDIFSEERRSSIVISEDLRKCITHLDIIKNYPERYGEAKQQCLDIYGQQTYSKSRDAIQNAWKKAEGACGAWWQ